MPPETRPLPVFLTPDQQRQLADARARGDRIATGARGIFDAVPVEARPWIFGFILGYLVRGRRR